MENNNNSNGGRSYFRRASDTESRELPDDTTERYDNDSESREERSNDSGDRSYGKPSGERRPYGKPGERSGGRSYGKPGERSGGSGGRSYGKPGERSYGKPGERSGGSGGRSYGKPVYGKPSERSSGKPVYGKEKEREERVPENLIFGIHPVREALEVGTEIEKIYFRRPASAGESYSPDERSYISTLDALRAQVEEAGVHIQEVPVEKLNRLTRNGNHQGVVAVVSAIVYKDINELTEELAAQIEAGEAPLVMLMDSVTDIRNFGAIARSAECAGAVALVMPAKNSAPVNAEAIKSSAGALTLIPVSRVGSLKGAIALLKGIGMQCVAATEKSNTLVYEADFTKSTVIVMGAEDRGISRDILNLCDLQVGIPLVGRIESLNVSAAAAIVLFEARRQRFERE